MLSFLGRFGRNMLKDKKFRVLALLKQNIKKC